MTAHERITRLVEHARLTLASRPRTDAQRRSFFHGVWVVASDVHPEIKPLHEEYFRMAEGGR